MNPKGQRFFKLLCNQYNGGDLLGLTKYLPSDEAKVLAKDPIQSAELSFFLNDCHELISKIHYSWLKTSFESIPSPLKPLYLASFSDHKESVLARFLEINPPSFTLSKPLKLFFLRRFIKRYGGEFSKGAGSVPQSELSSLLELEKKQLLSLIDLLGIHDLAEEIRHIVDKNKLGHIYNNLPPYMQSHLKICLKQKHRIPTKRLSLDQWNGSSNQLLNLVHKRGLVMLSKAISGQEPKFAWKLSRYLDCGRGKLVLKHYKKSPYPKITSPLISEINYLIKRINP